MTDFFIYSRRAIEGLPKTAHNVPHAIISIRTPGDPKEAQLPTNEHTRGILHMVFHDIDLYPPDVEKLILSDERVNPQELFTQAMAEEIARFVKANPVQRFLVHCDAGWSRSPAVAAAISKSVTGNDKGFFAQYTPNMRVYNALLDALSAQT